METVQEFAPDERQVLKPGHPRWEEFIDRLEGPEGCDFREDDRGKIVWACYGGYDKRFAEAILKTMPEIDSEKSIEFFNDHGGHCDCEIIFNVNG